jgi:hypothetical protein
MPHYPQLFKDLSEGVKSGKGDCGNQKGIGIRLIFVERRNHGVAFKLGGGILFCCIYSLFYD